HEAQERDLALADRHPLRGRLHHADDALKRSRVPKPTEERRARSGIASLLAFDSGTQPRAVRFSAYPVLLLARQPGRPWGPFPATNVTHRRFESLTPAPCVGKGDHLAPYATIVIGASSGGVEMLKELVAGLPADIPAAMFVVQHIG